MLEHHYLKDYWVLADGIDFNLHYIKAYLYDDIFVYSVMSNTESFKYISIFNCDHGTYQGPETYVLFQSFIISYTWSILEYLYSIKRTSANNT